MDRPYTKGLLRSQEGRDFIRKSRPSDVTLQAALDEIERLDRLARVRKMLLTLKGRP